jgi:radical SAM-linked protein
LRIRYIKHGKIRFTSHRDTARVWERTVRRAELPVAYSQGFSPHARLSFGLALSTGFESDAEYLDVDLDPARASGVVVPDLSAQLSALLPDGMAATGVAVLPAGAPSLQQFVTSCEYVIDLSADALAPTSDHDSLAERVASAVEHIRAAESVVVSRERKGVVGTADIRPAILALDYLGSSGPLSGEPASVRVRAELATQPKAVRPSELLAAFAIDVNARVRRTHQWIELEGLRSEPLPADDLGDAAVRSAASSAGAVIAAGAVIGLPLPGHSASTAAVATTPAVREEFFDVRLRGPRLRGLRQIS